MRHSIGFAVAAALAVSACSQKQDEVDPDEALASINVIDESNLSEL